MAYSLSDNKFVIRYVVGNTDPEKMTDEAAIAKQTERRNDALSRCGRLVAQEKNFFILNIGEHQVVSQYIVYHVGFERKPYWYKDQP